MKGIIEVFVGRNRATLLLLLMIFFIGIYSYVQMPRETNPDIQIPIINVSVNLQGIPPEDSERLLAIPMENELKSIQGIEEISSVATDDRAYVTLKFKVGFDSKKALEDVRAKMDNIRSKLPSEADHLAAHEVNLSLFSVINVGLIGNLPERTLNEITRNLKNAIETLPNVLSVEVAGIRKEIVEVIIKPSVFNSYNLQLDEILNAIAHNNRLIGAGVLEGDTGRYSIKISGTFKDVKDILKVPLRVQGDAVVTVADVAKVYYKFEDRKGFARINGKPAIVFEVSKRTGANVIETINQVKSLISKAELPKNLSVVYMQDQSDKIIDIIDDLENSIIFSMLLILIVMMLTMGTRISMLVSLAIPGSFLLGIIILHFMGITLNIVVLFSLIMAVGMLVDDSIVVNEYADRKMISGLNPSEAFRAAATDMFWPVTSATLTKLAVFIPLLFWPGVTGEFMKYIPITLIATLSSSLVIALIFTPTLGAIFGKPSTTLPEKVEKMNAIESGSLEKTSTFLKAYVSVLNKVLNNPKRFIFITITVLISVSIVYFKFGSGVEFFPSIEPDNAVINVRAKGNLSVKERDLILREVEDHILDMKDEIKIFYARSGLFTSEESSDDMIAKIQLEFANWHLRRKACNVIDDIRNRMQNIKGVVIEVQEEKMGPQGDKPIQINLSSKSWAKMEAALSKILTLMHNLPGFINIQDSRASPEIEWDIDIDRSKAMLSGTDITVVGEFIKMVTSGVIIGKYRPNNLDEEIDIIARFPKENRNLKTLDNLFVSTKEGPSPISIFTQRSPKNKISRINRTDGMRMLTVSADVASGYLASEQIEFIKLQKDWDKEVIVDFKGESKDQNEAQAFLLKAFILAIMLMILVLVTEFNSVYNTFIVMTAVFLSTTCVFCSLLLLKQVFGIVMGGVGIIALAGIIVNNNILLIDSFENKLKLYGVKEAIIRACISRVRPILLTVATTGLGLLPMITKISINFFKRKITYNAPASQWWTHLSITIASGLILATALTLFFTPALLYCKKYKGASE
ncbi:efflux RND transporter permease subunit [Candidatus Mesenet endosymbiont of Agriotes lineatus]|uniref:efflux RND transporter permease subunit n=1 Tax=Candidatus Mesenet endosymbiont of Agriotes lineatus TaxID=3077948 RepID=UPI0030D2389D